jgi:hypothetical protein
MYVVDFTDFTVGLDDECLVGTTALGVEVVGKAAVKGFEGTAVVGFLEGNELEGTGALDS